jgi:hypothetical protein
MSLTEEKCQTHPRRFRIRPSFITTVAIVTIVVLSSVRARAQFTIQGLVVEPRLSSFDLKSLSYRITTARSWPDASNFEVSLL